MVIPRQTMNDIGLSYRKYREEKMSQGVNLNDLTKMAPLSPETIKRKAGVSGRKGRGLVGASTTLNATQRALQQRGFKVEGRTGKVSPTPTTPLMDTGNMSRGTNIEARDNFLEVSQGKTREKILGYHQQGGGNLPQRVSLSWNKEFLDTRVVPILNQWLKNVIAKVKASGKRR